MGDPLTFSTHLVPEADLAIVTYEPAGDFVAPSDLRDVRPPRVQGVQGVILSGRCPMWMAAGLVQHYRDFVRWVALYEPREQAGIVVSRTGASDPELGALIPCTHP